jgi:ferredoxin-thioredoxin reductase catalytic subunit/rubredoxin
MREMPTEEQIEKLYRRLKTDAEKGGYNLNADVEFTKDLARGLLVNEERYGYRACPCRLASGDKEDDLDIICPCDYRDPDLDEFGACYCALYVSGAALKGDRPPEMIPERRPAEEERARAKARERPAGGAALAFPVWRCKVCGYLCAREQPPLVCPVCQAGKERFERFM